MLDISIILITYKSENIIKTFLEKVPKKLPVIIVDNSKSFQLKEDIENKYSNVNVFLRENNGVSNALNFGVSKIKTKYFIQISPDIRFNFDDLKIFLDLAKKLNDKFCAIGPRFTNVNEKSHRQINKNKNYDEIDSIHGSCMFINKDCFEKIGGFDSNFFLYFEETEYCFRAKQKGFATYQVNSSQVMTTGRSVENISKDKSFSNILIWHFIWSKYYFNKLKYGKLICLIIFLPVLIRTFVKFTFYKIIRNKNKFEKYKFRLSGLINSILEKKSSLRP